MQTTGWVAMVVAVVEALEGLVVAVVLEDHSRWA